MTRDEAIYRLGARYDEQAEQFPTMRNDIPRSLYIRANLRVVMRDDGTLPDGTEKLSPFARKARASQLQPKAINGSAAL